MIHDPLRKHLLRGMKDGTYKKNENIRIKRCDNCIYTKYSAILLYICMQKNIIE